MKFSSDPKTSDTVVVAPPTLIGIGDVADAFGLSPDWVRRLVRRRDPRVQPGYLGKPGGTHTWNANELFATLFTTQAALINEVNRISFGTDPGGDCPCGRPAHLLGLCRRHVHRLIWTFERAQDRPLLVWQLLAMCRWVVDRNQHLDLPDWDPWSGICMTPGCHNRNDDTPRRFSPLCRECASVFRDGCRTL